MNGSYSMQPEERENGAKVRDTFIFVSEQKREVKMDVWRDAGEEQSEPSCCLSVSKLSYTVR